MNASEGSAKGRRIAVFGYEKLAVDIAAFVAAGENTVLVVDSNEANLELARKAGLETASVDYSTDAELHEIGIGSTIDTVFCLLPDDAENVFLVISVRAIDARVPIISIADSPDSIPKFLAAGANKVVDPYEISGLKIWRLLKQPMIAEVMDRTLFSELDLQVGEVTISGGSFADGQNVESLRLRDHYNLVLLGVVDCELGDEFIFRTRGLNHRLEAGDILVVIGPGAEIRKLQRDLHNGTRLEEIPRTQEGTRRAGQQRHQADDKSVE